MISQKEKKHLLFSVTVNIVELMYECCPQHLIMHGNSKIEIIILQKKESYGRRTWHEVPQL